MIIKRIIPVLLAISFFLPGVAQVNELSNVTGRVISAENREPLPFVHIVNSTAKKGTTTDENGFFLMPAAEGDTLLFSAVGFDRLQFIVRQQAFEGEVEITLSLASVELDEVEVFAYRNAESFKDAVLKLELPEQPDKVTIPGSYDGPRKAYKPNPVLNPLSFAFNMFDKKSKERMKLIEVTQQSERWRQMKQKYDFIMETADLEAEEMEEFLAFCHLDYKTIEASTEYQLALAVNHCLPDFRNSKNK